MIKKILVIDDDESVAWVIGKALEPLGCEITLKHSIKTGLKALDNFNLIIDPGKTRRKARQRRESRVGVEGFLF